MKRILVRTMTMAGVALLGSALALAQQPMGGAPPSSQTQNPSAGNMSNTQQMQQMQQSSMQSMHDREFVHDALQGGMAEVELGHLAAEKGASADVREFGQKMVNDHTQLNDLLKQTAAKIDMNPPKGPSKKEKKLFAKLSALSGMQFDDAYIKDMVTGHTAALEDFRREAAETKNPAVKQAAEEGVKIVDGHLQIIKKIAQAHNIKS